jgi:curli biogenesis system outer membrane secretion channel CsgG
MIHRMNPTSVLSALLMALMMTTAYAQESKVEKCTQSLGTIAVTEARDGYGYLQRYGLGSPANLLRLMIQESGCFEVVERGEAFKNLQQERALAGSGELQGDSNIGKGQLQAADFVMTPNVQVSASDTGGVGGSLGAIGGRLFGGLGAAIGGVVGGVKFKEAETSLLIADVRSGIQVAAAQGQAKKTDFAIGGWGYGAGTWGAVGGYTKTPEGKMIAASLLDNYNNMVGQIRSKPQLIKARSEASANNAAASTRATNTVAAPVAMAAPVVAAAVAPAPMPAPQARPAAQTYSQQYPSGGNNADVGIQHVGSYSGSEAGAMMLSMDKNRNFMGFGSSPEQSRFPVTGLADSNGNLTLVRASPNGTYQYSGKYDGATGVFSGTWVGPGGSSGKFSGNKM